MLFIAKYENHPNVTKIRNKQASSVTFSFSLVEEKNLKNYCETKESLLKFRYSFNNN